MATTAPKQPASEIGDRSRQHLEAVLAIDSSSDEESSSIPSTPGQMKLARWLEGFFGNLGAEVELDEFANIIATLPGRGAGQDAAPLALMVHLDTAKGTRPIERLQLHSNWDGGALCWELNEQLRVDTQTFPSLSAFRGQDILHGLGDAPVGLDDKLGLAHLMTLAWLLNGNPDIPHPPLLLVGRPDEEIGREEALFGLAALLKDRGVRRGYTVDGIAPFEVNLENFNAAGASLQFEHTPSSIEGDLVGIRLVGVNSHGATAKAEGHRAATRLLSEALKTCTATVLGFETDPQRECDADVVLTTADRESLFTALDSVVEEHRVRGAGWQVRPLPSSFEPDSSADEMIRFVGTFLASNPGFTLLAEDSEAHDGYSHPFRSYRTSEGQRLDFRIRDFSSEGLNARLAHLKHLSNGRAESALQYSNMGPRLAESPELLHWAQAAASSIGRTAPLLPIRGGTGVDPFLDAGVCVANLGTGYFAPESEKELTSLQLLEAHASWLLALVQIALRQPSTGPDREAQGT